MMQVRSLVSKINDTAALLHWSLALRFFFFGLLLPLGFAPFHLPGFALLALAFFYHQLCHSNAKRAFFHGFSFGCGLFGFGVSWIFVSIHNYGHLNFFTALLITLLFIAYLSLFPALMALLFCRLKLKPFSLLSALAFSALWILSEYLRANLLTGFPWLLVGFGQFDTPSRYLLPLIGVYGVGLVTCFAASLLVITLQKQGVKRIAFLCAFTTLLLVPTAMKSTQWGEEESQALSVGVIQANMSMRDKWDESLLWALLQRYKHDAQQLLGTQLIIMPESAIPLPPSYITDFIEDLHNSAKKSGSTILLGSLQTSAIDNQYFNAMFALGNGQGIYLKQHLVPFGEYTPQTFSKIMSWLAIPDSDLLPGKSSQPLITVQNRAIASLICYEVAYGDDLLRTQLPQAQWIVSISDDGWFGHSLALYQHQQMAQVLSLETDRYQILANNDGLSSVINNQGEIIAALPAFSAGLLKSYVRPVHGNTPWAYAGDTPILLISLFLYLFCFFINRMLKKETLETIAAKQKSSYPYQPV